MTDREKLVELLHKGVRCPGVIDNCNDCSYHSLEKPCDEFGATADMLIANGIIVLPCKVGDDLWWIDAEDWSVKVDKGGVKGIAIMKDGVRIMDRSGFCYEIGTQYCYLSKEEAEAALEECEW